MTANLNLRVRRTAKRALGWDGKRPQTRLQRFASDLVIHNFLDMALRYRPIVRFLTRQLSPADRVLDVGSGPVGITPYLDRTVIGVDRNFEGPGSGRLRRCRADIRHLPFPDRAFPAVTCVDVLEHLPDSVRRAAVDEMVRVAGRWVVLAFPSGVAAAASDRELDRYLRDHLGRGDAFLTEHLEHGLPEVEEVAQSVREAAARHGRAVRIELEGNVNVETWLAINRSKAHLWRRAFLIAAFPIVLPRLGRRNQPPTYRQILFTDLG